MPMNLCFDCRFCSIDNWMDDRVTRGDTVHYSGWLKPDRAVP